jgi:hypothetical protein
MEKISSILPKSPRTQNTDHSKAQPARPGAPLFGRPAGRVTQKVIFEEAMPVDTAKALAPDISFAEKFSMTAPEDKISLSDDSAPEAKVSGYNRKGEMQNVKIAETISRKFANLDGPLKDSEPLSEEIASESMDSAAIDAT